MPLSPRNKQALTQGITMLASKRPSYVMKLGPEGIWNNLVEDAKEDPPLTEEDKADWDNMLKNKREALQLIAAILGLT